MIARQWGQKETQQSNRLQRRRQGEVEGIGGAHSGVGGSCRVCHRAAAKKTAAGGGGVPLTMALESSASASSPVGNRGRSLPRIIGKKGAGGKQEKMRIKVKIKLKMSENEWK